MNICVRARSFKLVSSLYFLSFVWVIADIAPGAKPFFFLWIR
jgi:hypothetical protein